MRIRLFALLLVPALTIVALAAAIVTERNDDHANAVAAAETASLASQISRADGALGVEALTGAQVIGGTAQWAHFAQAVEETDQAMDVLRTVAIDAEDAQLAETLEPIYLALSLRRDVSDGVVSPLQLLNRYGTLRDGLLGHLDDRATFAGERVGDPLRGLIALIEARSEHLNERLEIELALTYETWAPGLYSELARSIALQEDRLAEASRIRDGLTGAASAEAAAMLRSYREEILLEAVIPELSLESYQAASDLWIEQLDRQIATEASIIDIEFRRAESLARSERNRTALLVLLAFVAASVIAITVSYRIVHRLDIIADRARMFAKGELDRSQDELVMGNDEIGELAAVFDDMVEQVELRDRRLAKHASIDDLTEISNRRAIIERWEEAAQMAECTSAVCLVDLDNFKPINDEHGHHVGDKVLHIAGRRLSQLAETLGGSAGRLGGDEFLVVFEGLDPSTEALQAVTAQLVEDIRAPLEIEGLNFTLDASVGVVQNRSGVGSLSLLREADEAMYVAKNSTELFVISDSALRSKLAATKTQRSAIIEALNDGSFEPWFQPIFEFVGDGIASPLGGRISSFEALARWRTDDDEIRPPSMFLPVLESERLMLQFDIQIFESACNQLVMWKRLGLHVDRIAVNFAASSIDHPDFVDSVNKVLKHTECPPEHLAIEVTETGLMVDIESNAHRLQKIRSTGVVISADDFGTGYSSLGYLRDLPVDVVKLDRQFVASIETDEASQAIVRAVVSLARDLDLMLIAEGVETIEEFNWLIDNDVKYMQGYLLSRPIPDRDATEVLKDRRHQPKELKAA